jgi:hypothetical protein
MGAITEVQITGALYILNQNTGKSDILNIIQLKVTL